MLTCILKYDSRTYFFNLETRKGTWKCNLFDKTSYHLNNHSEKKLQVEKRVLTRNSKIRCRFWVIHLWWILISGMLKRPRFVAGTSRLRPTVRRMCQLPWFPAGPRIPVIYKRVGESVIYTATVRPAWSRPLLIAEWCPGSPDNISRRNLCRRCSTPSRRRTPDSIKATRNTCYVRQTDRPVRK